MDIEAAERRLRDRLARIRAIAPAFGENARPDDDWQAVELLLGELARTREALALLREIAPVVERKTKAGPCMHDVYPFVTWEQWEDYDRRLRAALKGGTP